MYLEYAYIYYYRTKNSRKGWVVLGYSTILLNRNLLANIRKHPLFNIHFVTYIFFFVSANTFTTINTMSIHLLVLPLIMSLFRRGRYELRLRLPEEGAPQPGGQVPQQGWLTHTHRLLRGQGT